MWTMWGIVFLMSHVLYALFAHTSYIMHHFDLGVNAFEDENLNSWQWFKHKRQGEHICMHLEWRYGRVSLQIYRVWPVLCQLIGSLFFLNIHVFYFTLECGGNDLLLEWLLPVLFPWWPWCLLFIRRLSGLFRDVHSKSLEHWCKM